MMDTCRDEFTDDVKVISKGKKGDKFHTAKLHNDVAHLPACKTTNNHYEIAKQRHENGLTPANNHTLFHEVDSDEEIFHRVNGLFEDKIHSYHDNPNSNSDSDDVVFDRKDSFDSTTESLFQTKPLMHPRKRNATKVRTKQGRGFINKCVWPLIYILLAIGAVVTLVFIIIYLFGFLTGKYGVGRFSGEGLVGCSHMTKQTVWTKGIPKLMTESAFRMVDVNGDEILDVLFGFATGAESYNAPDYMCDIYFNGSHPCLGGVLAMDGKDGSEIWRHYTPHEVFALNCGYDIDGDGTYDCLAAGRVSTFEIVSGRHGKKLWAFQGQDKKENDMNWYTGQFIPDLDGDGVPEILNVHGGDPFGEPGSDTRLKGKLVLFSGKNGNILQSVTVPDGKESYYSPVLLQRKDSLGVLFGTGGETHGGSLWFITLSDLYKGSINKAYSIYTDPHKGVMTPPVLLDMNGDGTKDIMFAAYNSSVMLIDGDTLEIIWNFNYPGSETYATPSPGYYTNDDVPDFMIHWQYGPGFPIYYYSMTTILDGATGKDVLSPHIKDSVGAQASPLTISVEGEGNDIFLYYMSDCVGHEGEGGHYEFVKGTNVHEQSRSDICKLRYNTEGLSKLNALNRHTKAPGLTLYNSLENADLEHSVWVNTTAEAVDFLYRHPQHSRKYEEWKAWKKHVLETGSFSNQDSQDYDNTNDDIYDTLSLMLKSILNKDDDKVNNIEDENSQDESDQYSLEDIKKLLNNDPELKKYYNKYKGGESIDDSTLNSYMDAQESSNKKLQVSTDPVFETVYNSQKNSDVNAPGYNAKLTGLHRTKYGSGTTNYLTDNGDDIFGNQRLTDDNYRRKSNIYNSPEYKDRTQYNPYRSGDDTESYNRPLYQKYENPFDQPSAYRTNSRNRGYNSNWRGSGDKKRSRKRRNIGNKFHQYDSSRAKLNKKKRHVGPHDGGNVQRLISTGTLAPTLLPKSHPAYNHSIDVIFATYWFYPAATEVILPEDKKCIEGKMARETERFDPKSKYYGMDDDGYEHAVTHECLEASGHVLPKDGIYESQSLKDPYIRHMGQMTIYRITLTCDCVSDKRVSDLHMKCSHILPYEQQQWSAYMGQKGDSHWKKRNSKNI